MSFMLSSFSFAAALCGFNELVGETPIGRPTDWERGYGQRNLRLLTILY